MHKLKGALIPPRKSGIAEGINDRLVPVSAEVIGQTVATTPVDDEIMAFAKGIRAGSGKGKDNSIPLDEYDNKGLSDCMKMSGILSRVPLIIALICLKVKEEGLWRGQGHEDHLTCLCSWLNLRHGSIRRYITAGEVLTALIKEHDISRLPAKIGPYIPFAKLVYQPMILTAFESAEAMSEGGIVTESIAEKAVAIQQKIGFPNKGKDAKPPKKKEEKSSQNTRPKEPNEKVAMIGKTSKTIVTHIMEVLLPTIDRYLAVKKRSEENIGNIINALQEVVGHLTSAIQENSSE